jgi:hypothetical protein
MTSPFPHCVVRDRVSALRLGAMNDERRAFITGLLSVLDVEMAA